MLSIATNLPSNPIAKFCHEMTEWGIYGQNTLWLKGLSTDMEVTVRDMDVTVEHTGTYLLRVTEMTVLNRFIAFNRSGFPLNSTTGMTKTDC